MRGEPFLYPEAIAAYLRDFLHRGEYLSWGRRRIR